MSTPDKKDLIDIEARLLEQEHRPFTLLKNFFNRKKWDSNDPRRKAVKIALIWRLVFSPASVAATGGFIALLSLIVLVWQTQVLIEQNEKIENQSYLIEAQRRSTLQFEISEILNRIDEELDSSNVNRNLSPQLMSRIIAATIVMKPYRSYENEILLPAYSYEKGQLFAALLKSNINVKDLSRIFESSNFKNMILNDVAIGGHREDGELISEIDLSNGYFEDVKFRLQSEVLDLSNSIIKNSEVTGRHSFVLLDNARLDGIKFNIKEDDYDAYLLRLNNTTINKAIFRNYIYDEEAVQLFFTGGENKVTDVISSLSLEIGKSTDTTCVIEINNVYMKNKRLIILNEEMKKPYDLHLSDIYLRYSDEINYGNYYSDYNIIGCKEIDEINTNKFLMKELEKRKCNNGTKNRPRIVKFKSFN